MASEGATVNRPPVDFFGREIKVGDRILYPGEVAGWATMNVGVVKEIVEVQHGYRPQLTTKLKVLKERNSRISRGEGAIVAIEIMESVVVFNQGEGS